MIPRQNDHLYERPDKSMQRDIFNNTGNYYRCLDIIWGYIFSLSDYNMYTFGLLPIFIKKKTKTNKSLCSISLYEFGSSDTLTKHEDNLLDAFLTFCVIHVGHWDGFQPFGSSYRSTGDASQF